MARPDATIDWTQDAISGPGRSPGPVQARRRWRPVLEPDREPEWIVGDAKPGALRGAETLVGGTRTAASDPGDVRLRRVARDLQHAWTAPDHSGAAVRHRSGPGTLAQPRSP